MSSPSEGLATLRYWHSTESRIRLFSLGSVSYIPEGTQARIKSLGFDKHGERNVVVEVEGSTPETPSFSLSGAQFWVMEPESVSEDFPLPKAVIDQYSLFVWITLRDQSTLLFAEPV